MTQPDAIHDRRRRPRRDGDGFARDDRGGATVEFVILFVPLMALVLLAAQVSISYFFLLTATDAAARGARLAATLPPSHCAALRNAEGDMIYMLDKKVSETLPETAAERYCLNDPSPCRPLPASRWTCTVADVNAGVCDRAVFDAVAREMAGPGVDPEEIEIVYEDSRLGEAGGRVVPLVTVRVRAFDFAFRSLFWEKTSALPPISASIIGESMGFGRAPQMECG